MTQIYGNLGLCKQCGAETIAHFIESTSSYARDSDGCSYSRGYQPLEYVLAICPQCSFIGTSNEFNTTIKAPSKEHWEQYEKLRREYPAS